MMAAAEPTGFSPVDESPRPSRALARIRVVHSEDMVADVWRRGALGPIKGAAIAQALLERDAPVLIVPPEPATLDDLERTHDPEYVADVLAGRRSNGFGTRSDDFARSLPFVVGAVTTAARLALEDGVSASLTCGFHHAGYAAGRSFCTFNGLVVAAQRLFEEGRARTIHIIDGDYHPGDGTRALVEKHRLGDRIRLHSFGEQLRDGADGEQCVRAYEALAEEVASRPSDLVLYQAGVDVHRDDPLGGLLTDEQMRRRDEILFLGCRRAGVPISWNLAGGYQVEPDGSFPRTVQLHLDTFDVAARVFVRGGC